MGDVADGVVVALDIGGTKLAAGVVDRGGTLIAWRRTPTHVDEGPDAVIARLLELARCVAAEAGIAPRDALAAGVACGGPLDADRGVILNALNNPGWIDVPLGRTVSEALGVPAWIENDANAAALAEHRWGAGRSVANMTYLTISTGVGGAVILDGRLHRGENGNAWELGHISVDHDGRPCHCGGRGCLEAYASGTNIALRAREAIAAGEPSVLPALAGGADGIRAETVVEGVRRGDALATVLWAETLALLAAAIASFINLFNPRLVVLGGGVTNAGDLLFAPLRRQALARAMPQLAAHVEIVPAQLGDRTGVLGAAAVAIDRVGDALDEPRATARTSGTR